MSVSVALMTAWCRELLGGDPRDAEFGLEQYLEAIPRLETLADLPSGTPVLVRGDVDCKPGAAVGDGDVRLRSMIDTLEFGKSRGWKQIIFGHIGRKLDGSLKSVAKRLGELLKTDVPLISDWLDEASTTILPNVVDSVAKAAPGQVIMLENTRRYAVERLLWEASPQVAPRLAEPLAKIANEFAEKVAGAYVNEALSAGSLDTSSTVVPAAMQRVALGRYVGREFDGPMRRCLRAKLVVFSGLKADKLDDLQAMIQRGTIRCVIAAGSLAMALKKAAAEVDGKDFCLGLAESPEHRDKPYYIERKRINQAKQMLDRGRENGVEFVLPVDFVLQDGRVAEVMSPTDQQFDVGPKSSELFEKKVGEFIAANSGAKTGPDPAVMFHNGVFGMFEEPRFEAGTRRFVGQFKRMTDAGIEVYVGGGEGGTALEKYGQPNWVTHCFTAGGTVLNALGGQPVPYLVALRRAALR